mgnify:CR=1 FL=1
MSSSLLDLYSDYLISSFGQTSATGLSRLTDGAVSHDRITRFLSESALRRGDRPDADGARYPGCGFCSLR